MKLPTSQFDSLVSEYFNKINNTLTEKLKSQFNGTIQTVNCVYKIVKIEDTVLREINFEGDKLHKLFDPNGCKISGTLFLKAAVYLPNSEEIMSQSFVFKIMFKPTLMNFDFNSEKFIMEEVVEVSYINKEVAVERLF